MKDHSSRQKSQGAASDAMRASLERHLRDPTREERSSVPPTIPDHALLHSIGSGSYGDVWLARSALGTLRAVKAVYRARFKDDRPYEREFNGILKYEPISRTHEGLVQVLHVGRNDEAGCFYYVMELADDSSERSNEQNPAVQFSMTLSPHDSSSYVPRTLRLDLARHQRLSAAEAAKLVLRLAGALGHLHAHGLVHRDIKPSNVIFVSGQPKLADIGLVTDVGSSHSFVGTEGFIPPEGPGTPQADLYGLGKLLYELATGRDRMDFPQLPPGVMRLPDGEGLLELNEIMTRACAPQPNHRYASATELQADLNLFLAGRSLRRARNIERHLARLKKFAAAACVFLILAAAALWFFRREERRANERAREAVERAATESQLRQRAEGAERQIERQLYTALLEQARATVRSGELGQRVQALDAVRRAAAISNSVELRREAIAALALPDLRFERELPTGLDCTMAVLDPKFERLALGRGTNAIEIRSVPEQRLLMILPAAGIEPVASGKWSPDGRYLGIVRKQRLANALALVEIWDTAAARPLPPLPRSRWGAFAFHPSLPRVLIDTGNEAVSVWNLESATSMATFAVTGFIHHLEFSPDGKGFLAQHRIDRAWFTSLHDAESGAARQTVPSGWIDGIAWEAQDRWVAFAARNGEVHLHDRRTGTTSLLGRHKSEANTAVFSPDGDFLFTGGAEQEILCWDMRTQQRAFTIGLRGMQMQFRRDSDRCAVVSGTGVTLHSFIKEGPYRALRGDLGGSLRHGAFSKDGRWLAVGGFTRLGLWDLAGEAPAAMVVEAEHAKPFFSPDGLELFAFWTSSHGRWRIAPGHDAWSSPGLTALPALQAKRIYSGQFTSNSLVLGTGTGALIVPRSDVAAAGFSPAYTGYVTGQVSPDGQWFAALKGESMLIFRLDPWVGIRFVNFDADLRRHAFTPSGDELAVASRTGITFLDTNRWDKQRHFPALLPRYPQLIFTPNGRAFWLAQDARDAALRHTRTFEPLLQLPAGMTPLALSSDGRYLAASMEMRHLQVWDLVELLARLRELGLGWPEP